MKNLKLTLLGCMILLACVAALGLPALASNSGTTTVSGTVPLIIYNVQASGITGSTATISWRTNGNSTSQVFYDTESHPDTTLYAFHSPEDNALVLQHGVGLNGLWPSTTYHYRVKSTAIIGGIEFVAVSPDYTFKTLPAYIPPGVITIGALPMGSTSALLWGILYNKGSASSVEVYFQWGTTTSYGHQTAHQTLTGAPNIILASAASLIPNTTYHFRAVAVGDGTSYGQDQVFRTLPLPTVTVVTPNGGQSWAAGTSHTISWTYASISGGVRIELLKGGVLNRVISLSSPIGTNGNGSFIWVIPSMQATGNDYKIRVTSLSDPACTDSSDHNFTITKR